VSELRTGKLIPYMTEMFRFQAWVAMGKVAHPVSGSVERDLGTAKEFIDLLAELETRTDGHRSEEESKLLRAALTDLRINFVDEMAKPAPAPAGGAETGAADAPSADSERESTSGETEAGDGGEERA
jgi:hypothetical protein